MTTKAIDEAPTPSLRGLIDKLIDQKMATVTGPMPGRVTAYDSTKQRVSVQPLVERVYYDEIGTRTTQARPIIQDVPVYFPGGGDTRITTGVKAGDTVLLIPCGVSISRWAVRGGQVDPGEESGSLSDCIALVGLHDFAHVPTTALVDAIVTHGETRVGGPMGTEKMILGETYRSAEDILFTALGVCLTALADNPTQVTAAATANTAISTFQAAAATYLATKGRVL